MDNSQNGAALTGTSSTSGSPQVCPDCDADLSNVNPIDICDRCHEDFGDCDGSCGNPDCGNQHCMSCGYDMYSQCCPTCRKSLPVEMWI